MNDNDPNDDLLKVAGRILDRTPVDWSDAPASDSLTAELQAIESVARLAGDVATPSRWGPLQVLEKVGEGAFGTVFRAWDTRLDREVALKLLQRGPSPMDDGAAIAEGRLLARVKHPNVVTVFGAEAIDGRVGIWTEYIHGETLTAIVGANGPMTHEAALAIGMDLCGALQAIHGAHVMHGDVKAENVLREKDGRIVLVDLGTGHEQTRAIASASQQPIRGTPLYMAPELWRQQPPTSQTDLYSLGVLLYFLTTGEYPVRGKTTDDVRAAHQAGRRVPLAEARPTLPPAFTAVVERAIDPNPAARFESAHAFRTALQAIDPSVAKRKREQAIRIALGALGVAGLVALTWMTAVSLRRSQTDDAGPTFQKLTAGAAERQLNASAISSDGKRLVYADSKGAYVQDIESKEVRSLTLPAGFPTVVDVGWASADDVLVSSAESLWRVPLGFAPPVRVAEVGGRFAVSPDGRLLAVRQMGTKPLVIMTIDGRDLRELPPGGTRVAGFRPAWSPTGQRVAYLRLRGQGSSAERHLVSRDLNGGPEVEILNVIGGFALLWLSDGRVLFSVSQAAIARFDDVYAIRADPATGVAQGGPQKIAFGSNLNFRSASQTRDGRVAFTSTHIWSQIYAGMFDRATTALGNLRQVTFTTTDDQASGWTHSGRDLLFIANAKTFWNVFQTPLERPEPRLLSASMGEVWDAAVSPDGQYVIFAQSNAIKRVPVSGGPVDELFKMVSRNALLECGRSADAVCVASTHPDNVKSTELVSFRSAQSEPRRYPLLSVPTWDLSADGRRVAGTDAANPQGGLVILDLVSGQITRLTVPDLRAVDFVAWVGSDEWLATRPLGERGSEILHVNRAGMVKVLWRDSSILLRRLTVSPDGTRVALTRWFLESDAYLMRGF